MSDNPQPDQGSGTTQSNSRQYNVEKYTLTADEIADAKIYPHLSPMKVDHAKKNVTAWHDANENTVEGIWSQADTSGNGRFRIDCQNPSNSSGVAYELVNGVKVRRT